jgi:hypothetical protein
LPDAAFEMSEKDVLMWEFLFILPFPASRNCVGRVGRAVMVERSGFLRCAAQDEAVSCFGGDDNLG